MLLLLFLFIFHLRLWTLSDLQPTETLWREREKWEEKRFIDFWVCMSVYKYLWASISIYEGLWMCMSIYECVLTVKDGYECVSVCKWVYECVCVSISVYEHLWACISVWVWEGVCVSVYKRVWVSTIFVILMNMYEWLSACMRVWVSVSLHMIMYESLCIFISIYECNLSAIKVYERMSVCEGGCDTMTMYKCLISLCMHIHVRKSLWVCMKHVWGFMNMYVSRKVCLRFHESLWALMNVI